MTDIFSFDNPQLLWLSGVILGLGYLLIVWGMRSFLKPSIINNLDPLNINLVTFIAPAILGLLIAPFLLDAFTFSLYTILFFLAVWLLLVRFIGKPRRVDLRDRMDADFQIILLSLAIVVILLNVLVNMIIPGTIPILMEGGVYSRFEASQNSRLVSWLSLGLSPMPGLLFAITERRRVRSYAVCGLIVQIVAGLLSASKGAILALVLIVLNAMFFAKVRGEHLYFNKLRKILIFSAGIVLLLIPLYFAVIGFGGENGLLMPLAVRFLGGYDQLIYSSIFDLLKGMEIGSSIHANLLEYQWMPVFKALTGRTYEYSTIGQYVLEKVTGIYIDGPFTFPNSNLILETIFTCGVYFGLVAFVIEMLSFYLWRFWMIKQPITPLNLLVLYAFLFQPMGLFASGQEWISEVIVTFFVIMLAWGLAALWRRMKVSVGHLVSNQTPASPVL